MSEQDAVERRALLLHFGDVVESIGCVMKCAARYNTIGEAAAQEEALMGFGEQGDVQDLAAPRGVGEGDLVAEDGRPRLGHHRKSLPVGRGKLHSHHHVGPPLPHRPAVLQVVGSLGSIAIERRLPLPIVRPGRGPG